MKILQEALESALEGIPHELLTQLVAKKLAAQGIKLSKRERERLGKKIREGGADNFRLGGWNFWDRRKVHVEFTQEEIKEAERRSTEFLNTQVPGLIRSTAEDLSTRVLIDLKGKWAAESRRQKREFAGFTNRLYERWQSGLKGLRMLVTISKELGSTINQEIRSSSQPNRKNLVEVITRSHARACQITEEIIGLLSAGFADGAMARWRTLHEIAVVALLIAVNGEELAERYVLHQIVESKRPAREYERYCERLGCERLDPDEIRELDKSYAALERRFGRDFVNRYGWAAHHLRKHDPTFADIERAARIDHLRPYYRMASHNVHASPKSVFFKLGLLSESEILLSGPSNAGLADPGHSTAISLVQVSTTLHEIHPALDTLVALKMMLQLADEIGESFGRAHAKLEDDSSALSYSYEWNGKS